MTAGAGHRRAAEALAQAVSAQRPHAHVRCVDVLTYAPGKFHIFYNWSYLVLVRHLSWIWKITYHLLDWTPCYRLVQPFRRMWNLAISRRFRRLLAEMHPDLVLTTHFLPADVLSAEKRAGRLQAPLVVVVTDLHPHWFWIAPEPELYIGSTPKSRELLEARGVRPERVRVCGIPITSAFATPVDRPALLAKFKLDPERLTVLVTSGGTTVGPFEQVVEALLSLDIRLHGRLQLVVVCGQDEVMQARLTRRAHESPVPMTVFGFVNIMAELMGISQLIVSKAGGLTVSEAMGRGVPLVLYHIIPGQERLNARYVAEQGAGIIAPQPRDVAKAVARVLEEPGLLGRMTDAARHLGHPEAARVIADAALSLIGESGPLRIPGVE